MASKTPSSQPRAGRKGRPLASRVPAALLRRELAALPKGARLAAAGGLQCWLLEPGQGPSLLREIGRAREAAFRAAGEGTGKPLDLDAYDRHYLQLLLWDEARGEVAGGYRLGPTREILASHGLKGLYTHSLLRFQPPLMRHLDPGLELGRSFVGRRWQRSFAPLLLLWKGIGAYVVAHPHCRRLFGVVSMSARYRPRSRGLIASYVKQHLYRGDLAALTRPRRPFGPAYRPSPHDRVTRAMAGGAAGLEDLDALIRGIEPDGKGLPVLFRQYSRLGGYFFGFNLDPAFGNALDGLVCVDLARADPRVLARYLGPAGTLRFLAAQRGALLEK